MSDSTSAEALGYLREGVKADPRNATAWLALGIGLQNLGREAEAKGPYREYLKLKPTGAQAQEVREVLRLIP
jgi:Flp pilus assembly protein TadD